MSPSPADGPARPGRMIRASMIPAGLLAIGLAAHAQEPKGEIAASSPAKTTVMADLTHRYRLMERYAPDETDAAGTPLIGPYRVGVVEITKDSIDVPKGSPKRSETARQLVYVERPAEVSTQGIPAATVRTFERFQVRPGDAAEAVMPRPFEGLSVYCRPRPGEASQLLSLTEGRRLRDTEYELAARVTFLPHASQILPAQPVRVGETWRIPRKAAQALIGEAAGPVDALTGKLVELRREADGPRLVAVIGISGRVESPSLQAAVNAEALFTGLPEDATPPADATAPATAPAQPPARADDGIIETRGGLTEIRMARTTTGLLPGPGRLHYRTTREVVVHRQLGLGNDAATIPRPPARPEPTDANAWLSYLDPRGRFGFDHPQDLLPPDPYQLVAGGIVADPETATLTRGRRDGHDLLQVEYVGKVVTPELLRQKLASKWGSNRLEVMKGGEEWLPEAEWPRMKVHRIEAAIQAPDRSKTGNAPRIHFDGYLIQFGQSASILAVATTSRDNVAAYRQEIERILKSLQISPARSVEG
ncbi:hypothetical protein TA3x_002604 [Tundrisphaera sp. TA3]|uniref:hypothetical protein n=1 Tax=Tundrisphaera sp. TA3 TaxID=3435775 RepID=UPI003EBEBFAD